MQTTLENSKDKTPHRPALENIGAFVAVQQKAFLDSMFDRQKADSTFWASNEKQIQDDFNELIAAQRAQLIKMYGVAFTAQVMGYAENEMIKVAAEYAREDGYVTKEVGWRSYNDGFTGRLPLPKSKGTV